LGAAMLAAPKLMDGEAHLSGQRSLIKEILSWVWGYPLGILLVLFALYLCRGIYSGFMLKDDSEETSQQELIGGSFTDVWRHGYILILGKSHALPSRCIHCNTEVTTPPQMHTLTVEESATDIHKLWDINNVSPEVQVRAFYCVEHTLLGRIKKNLGARTVFISIIIIFSLCALAKFGVRFSWEMPIIFCSFGMILFGTFFAWRQLKGLQVVKIDEKHIYIKGCGEKFLDSLPQFNSRRD
jgi:hypothetical protein